MITIINYGMGNLGSVANMFRRIGVATLITGDKQEIEQAEKILLPGVGAFDPAMQKLNNSGLREILDKKALEDKIPILGICLGMQLLTNGSEEGKLDGLGWINAQTYKFKFDKSSGLKIPHMGWNNINLARENILFTDGMLPRFYFVHSYYVKAINPLDVLATTSHGIDFDSVVQHDNIFGAQFHPEKSHKFGMRFLENFAKI